MFMSMFILQTIPLPFSDFDITGKIVIIHGSNIINGKYKFSFDTSLLSYSESDELQK